MDADNLAPSAQDVAEPTDVPQAGDQIKGQEPTPLDALIKSLRAENASMRVKNKAYETERSLAEQAKLKEQGEWEKLAKQHETTAQAAEARAKAANLKYEAAVVASRLGITKPDLALRLVDLDAVEYDGDRPANLDALLQAVIAELPGLVQGAAAPAPKPSGNSINPGAKPTLSIKAIEAMSLDEYGARQPEIMQWLASNGGRLS